MKKIVWRTAHTNLRKVVESNVVSVNNIDAIVSFTCRATAKFSAVVQQAVHEEGFGRVWLFKVVEVFQKDRNGQQNCLYAVY